MNEEERKNEEEVEKIDELEERELDEQETFTYQIDNNNVGGSSKEYNEKNSFIYILIGFVALFLIILILIFVSNKTESKNLGYEKIETKLVDAAKKYYNNNEDKLPVMEENSTKITSEKLIETGYLKPLNEMTKENISCDGHVEVYKQGEDYVYFPYLECGDKYKSISLTEKLKEDSLTTEKDGLYSVENEYVFKGDEPNNNVKFDGSKWKIIKINEDGSIKLIYNEKKLDKVVWDDRYNSDVKGYTGKNDFRISRMLEYLTESYDNNKYVSKTNKKYLVKHNWCIGKITDSDVSITNLNPCSDIYSDLYIGLARADEILEASIENECKTIFNTACTNYNYFFDIDSGWTLNAIQEKTDRVMYSSHGTIYNKKASDYSTIRPVININSNVLYASGEGTEANPYTIGE